MRVALERTEMADILFCGRSCVERMYAVSGTRTRVGEVSRFEAVRGRLMLLNEGDEEWKCWK